MPAKPTVDPAPSAVWIACRMDEKKVIWPVWSSAIVVAPEPLGQWLAKDAERALLKRAV